MNDAERQKILKGRKVIETYRTAHAKLHSVQWHKSVPEDHTPIYNTLIDGLKTLGFKSIDDFFKLNYTMCYELSEYYWDNGYYRIDGVCDGCKGRKVGCGADMLEKYGKNTIGTNQIAVNMIKNSTHGLVRRSLKNREFLNPVGCSMKIITLKKPEIDWAWE